MSLSFKIAWFIFAVAVGVNIHPLFGVGLILMGVAADEIVRRFGDER